MTKLVLVKVAPWPMARILAVLYLVIGIIVMPILLIAVLVSPESNPAGRAGGIIAAMLMPFIYAAIGLIGGAFASWMFNVLARLLGGVPLTFDSESVEAPPAVEP